VNCTKIAGDIPREPAYKIFLASNVDFSSLSLDPLGSRRPVQASVK